MLVQHLADSLCEGAVELGAGDVDVDREAVVDETLGSPDGELAHRLVHHPQPDFIDHPALLGEWDELAGGDQSHLRVLPPQQRLGRDHRAGDEADHRLVHDRELRGRDGVEQCLGEIHPTLYIGPLILVVQGHTAATLALGPIHRGVSVADQRGRVVIVGGDGDADTCTGVDRPAGELNRFGPRPGHSVTDVEWIGLSGRILDEDRELVATQPGDHRLRGSELHESRCEQVQ